MRAPTALLVLVTVLAACGDDVARVTSDEPPREAPRYTATTTVLESPDHGPQLCLGGVMESYPPQCGGPDVVGWDWEAVDDAEAAGGTTWGTYTVVGTWDGERLTLTEPPRPPERHGDGSSRDFSTPCEPPPGGWAVVDPDTATQEGQDAALAYANEQPDFAGAWLDQSINPAYDDERGAVDDDTRESALNDPERLVLNVRFTGDLSRHEAAIREVWGGALCVTEARHTLEELRSVQQELHSELDALMSSTDEVRGVVELQVLVAEEGLQEELDERYGAGVVEVSGALEPVDG